VGDLTSLLQDIGDPALSSAKDECTRQGKDIHFLADED